MYLHMQGVELVLGKAMLVTIEQQTLKLDTQSNSKIIKDKIVKTVHKIDKIHIANIKIAISLLQTTKTNKFHLLLAEKDLQNLEQEQIWKK